MACVEREYTVLGWDR